MTAATTCQSNNSHNLHILQWNANGIICRKIELLNFLDLENADIALIAETHLTPLNQIKFCGYDIYSCHHPDNVSHSGTHYELNHLAQQHFQVTCVAVKYNGLLTTMAFIYSSPRHTVSEEAYTEFFNHFGQR